jgi:hypothetical protein
VAFEDLPEDLQPDLRAWSAEYEPVHAVAHWEDRQRRRVISYDQSLEEAAKGAERLLGQLGREIAPRLLDHYPVVLWEDQDECLEVRPEDIPLS